MASTKQTRKPRAKVIEKIKEAAENLEVSETKVEEVSDTLSHDHLLQLETTSRDIENKKLRMAVEEQALKNMTLELENLTLKIEKQKLVLNQVANSYEMSKKSFGTIIKEMAPKYGVQNGKPFSYDPMTGKVELD